jgi:hypothetical protein
MITAAADLAAFKRDVRAGWRPRWRHRQVDPKKVNLVLDASEFASPSVIKGMAWFPPRLL